MFNLSDGIAVSNNLNITYTITTIATFNINDRRCGNRLMEIARF